MATDQTFSPSTSTGNSLRPATNLLTLGTWPVKNNEQDGNGSPTAVAAQSVAPIYAGTVMSIGSRPAMPCSLNAWKSPQPDYAKPMVHTVHMSAVPAELLLSNSTAVPIEDHNAQESSSLASPTALPRRVSNRVWHNRYQHDQSRYQVKLTFRPSAVTSIRQPAVNSSPFFQRREIQTAIQIQPKREIVYYNIPSTSIAPIPDHLDYSIPDVRKIRNNRLKQLLLQEKANRALARIEPGMTQAEYNGDMYLNKKEITKRFPPAEFDDQPAVTKTEDNQELKFSAVMLGLREESLQKQNEMKRLQRLDEQKQRRIGNWNSKAAQKGTRKRRRPARYAEWESDSENEEGEEAESDGSMD